MKDLIIVGGGGYFLEIYEYLIDDIANGRLNDIRIKGVLDDVNLDNLNYVKYLGPIKDYEVQNDDVFIIAIGNAKNRESIFLDLIGKEATFFRYIHHSAVVAESARIGNGTIVCPFSIINAFATVGENVSINVHACIGHEATVGRSSVISPYAALNGVASIGAECFLGTRSTIFPGVEIGKQCIVDSHTAVRKSAAEKMILSERTSYVEVRNRMIR